MTVAYQTVNLTHSYGNCSAIGVLHPPAYNGRYPDGRITRENRVVPQLLPCLFPQLRPGRV